VGIVDNSKIVDGSEMHVGNTVIGIASSGLHSNGYSLARKICFDVLKLKIDDYIPDLGMTIGEELIKPTKIYSAVTYSINKRLPVHGFAHITGGGIEDNLIRVIPKGCGIEMYSNSWDVPPVFSFLQNAGNISDSEMMRTFNNGLGMIAVVAEDMAQDVLEQLSAMKEKGFIIGKVVERKESDTLIKWV